MTQRQLKKSQILFLNKTKTLLVCFLLILSTNLFSQEKKITGKVTDKNGEPLVGTAVIIKGSLKGTETDFDGNYQINTEPSSVLVFNHIGFKSTEKTVENQTIINITLEEDSESLDEVVIVGYGTQKKSDLTGAIGQVKSEELTKVTTTTAAEALQGRVAGVSVTSSTGSPGSSASVLIRGIASFGNNQPLYIVDGVEADSYFIDPRNIESIEILKDASSAAIYGTRGANGVVIITTKKGKKGKISIEIEQSYSVNTQRKKINLLDADGYVKVHRQMYENAGNQLPNYVTNPSDINTNWIDETHRDGNLNLLSARVSGASENINYSFGGNYADEKGLLIGSSFLRKGFFVNGTLKRNKVTLTANINYSETKRNPYKFSLGETFRISPLIPVYDDTKESGFGYRDGQIGDHRNPVADDHFRQRYTKLRYLLTNFSAQYEILKGLNLKANYSFSNQTNFDFSFNTAFRARDNDTNENNIFAFISENDGFLRKINQVYTADYNLSFGNHDFKLLAGYQRISTQSQFNYVQAQGYREVNGTREPVQLLDNSFNTLNAFSAAQATFSGSGSNATYNIVSQFGRFNYTYKNKYLFQASIRRDGSSKFGKNRRYGIFPSFSAGWKITEEKFMENQDVFSFLKLRASWGQAGNDTALGYYDQQVRIRQGSSQGNGGYVFGDPQTSATGSIVRDLENVDLQWEESTSTNIGLDYGVLNGKLKGGINYYNTISDKVLLTRALPDNPGIDNDPIVNFGEFQNSGFEFDLNYNTQISDVNFSATATFSTLKSEVTRLGNESQILRGAGLLFGADHFVNQTKLGYEPGAYFLPVANGIFQSQAEIDTHDPNGTLQPNAAPGDVRFIDQNGDGVLDSNDEVYQGSALPSYEYSLNLNADYKGIDFNIFFQGVGGNKIYNGNRFQSIGMDSGRNFESSTLNAWTPTNTNTNIPRAVLGDPNGNNRASTRFLENGSYLRIKTIQLGYSLPQNILDKINVSKLRLYVTGQNLFTFTDYSGLDPEVGGSVLSRGIDRTLYPQFKSVILGFQLQL
ncbi:TonB-dependent receptor [Tenacibaculum holothuriorum]|uniref:TonB-dependent receptor n=1 Tax=Tenacibaculum holothuriorum TaxID=1635173 RepID=A0A1Y2P8P8_9FLAO|nr:TonB-dependent receptor [Tenacibaculum holothuriorum]OSY86836.1 TonB-dependent receptor [Tenacibaculum holothuriorum]